MSSSSSTMASALLAAVGSRPRKQPRALIWVDLPTEQVRSRMTRRLVLVVELAHRCARDVVMMRGQPLPTDCASLVFLSRRLSLLLFHTRRLGLDDPAELSPAEQGERVVRRHQRRRAWAACCIRRGRHVVTNGGVDQHETILCRSNWQVYLLCIRSSPLQRMRRSFRGALLVALHLRVASFFGNLRAESRSWGFAPPGGHSPCTC